MILNYIKGVFIISENIYYNQKDVIDEIHNDTGYSKYDISKILNSLKNVIKDKISDSENITEIKIFPGLKITSKYVSQKKFKTNLNISDVKSVLLLNAEFGRRFKDQVKELYCLKHKN